jgi:hypothetical protein
MSLRMKIRNTGMTTKWRIPRRIPTTPEVAWKRPVAMGEMVENPPESSLILS